MGSIGIRLIGSFEISCDGAVIVDSSAPHAKALAIVKLLALDPSHKMHRDRVIDLLWPDADVDSGANNLYKNLHRLRRTLIGAGIEDLVRIDQGVLSLKPGTSVDLDDLRGLVKAVREDPSIETLTAAVELCRGELLPRDPYDEWTVVTREEIRRISIEVRIGLATHFLNASHHDDAARQYIRALELDPADEEAHRGLMRAYASMGRRDLALRQYEQCKLALERELQTQPARETEVLASDIRERQQQARRDLQIVQDLVKAGDQALRRATLAEAVEKYTAAIELLGGSDQDVKLSCELRLRIGDAQHAAGNPLGAAEEYRRVVDLAGDVGARDLHARALYCYQESADTARDNHAGQREALELVEYALSTLPAEDSVARALLLIAGSRPSVAAKKPSGEAFMTGRIALVGERGREVEERVREAVRMARAVGDPWVLVACLERLRVLIAGPDTLAERLMLSAEMSEAAARSGAVRPETTSLHARHEDLMESGDLEGARIQARQMQRLAERTASRHIRSAASGMMAALATADGDLARAERLIFDSLEQSPSSSNAQMRFGLQLFMLRWHQGRAAETEPALRRALDQSPSIPSTRALLAMACAAGGAERDAREHYDVLLREGVYAIPRDFVWWLVTYCLAHLATQFDDARTARDLYSLLRPHANTNAIASNSASFGCVAFTLANLAAALGDCADAQAQFEAALTQHIRTRQHAWTARTRWRFAEMLVVRGAKADLPMAQDLMRVALREAMDLGLTPVELGVRELMERLAAA